MITIFRRIRQKLIGSGSFTKYLLYATGEILLVMIGILLALQVNNWNEERKLRIEEQYLVQQLKEEFSINLQNIYRDFRGNQANLNASNEILEMFHQEYSEINVDQVDSLLGVILMSTSFDPATGVVDEIIGTGRLNVLRDDSLRNLIAQWPSVLQDQQEDIEIRGDHLFDILIPAIMTSAPIKNVNRHFSFDFWSDEYSRATLSPSAFEFKKDEFFTLRMEGYLFSHSLNQDFILMNDLKTESYIKQILRRLEEVESS